MAYHDIVVIGASAGGVEALQELVRRLPAALPATVAVVVHISPWHQSNLAEILSRAGSLPAHEARNGERIRRGQIYVPSADQHLLLENHRTVVVRGPKENRNRPAIDPLFRSAAIGYGPRVIGVILSGNLDDGTSGLWQIKRRGGLAVVQDPKEARFSGMPESALANVQVDHVVPLSELAALLIRLVKTPAPKVGNYPIPKHMLIEQKVAKMEDEAGDIYHLGRPSVYVCPECSGTLFVSREGRLERFRCRTGHAYTEGSLLAEQVNATEAALWTGVRALREQADLLRQRAHVHPRASSRHKRLLELSHQAEQQAIQVRTIIIENNGEGMAGLTGTPPGSVSARSKGPSNP